MEAEARRGHAQHLQATEDWRHEGPTERKEKPEDVHGRRVDVRQSRGSSSYGHPGPNERKAGTDRDTSRQLWTRRLDGRTTDVGRDGFARDDEETEMSNCVFIVLYYV